METAGYCFALPGIGRTGTASTNRQQQQLLQRGHHLGLVANLAGTPSVEALQLDVTSDSSIGAAAHDALA